MTSIEVEDFYEAGRRRIEQRTPLTKVASAIFPEYLLKQIKSEFQMLLVRIRSRNVARAYRGKTDLLVNVGAGDAGRQGWVNIDRASAPNVNCICDARKGLPFADNSVKGIFSEHFFEHIDYTEEAPYFLAECYRVLQRDGVLRIIVPDAEKYLRAYVAGDWQELAALRPLDANHRDHHFPVKYSTRMELVNVVFRQSQEHKFAYDYETLSLLLKRNRFRDVLRQEFGTSVAPEICLDLKVRASESLYVEAIK